MKRRDFITGVDRVAPLICRWDEQTSGERATPPRQADGASIDQCGEIRVLPFFESGGYRVSIGRIFAIRDMFDGEDDTCSDGEVPEGASTSPSWVALPDCIGVAEPFRIDLEVEPDRREAESLFDFGGEPYRLLGCGDFAR